jgi:SAM-dependent methyltransferase
MLGRPDPVRPGPEPLASRVVTVDVPPAVSLTPQERLDLRRSCAFASAAEGGRILEIGAAHHGTFPKRDGFRTSIVDHTDRAGLVEKYQDFPQYDMASIEEVDYVLTDGVSLVDVVDESFDLVYASHVLEHSTSLVHFVNECAQLLEPDGVLALVVPDSRYCFDHFRERTSLGRVIDTFHARPAVHTIGTLTEFGLYAVKHRGSTSWLSGHRGSYSMVRDTDEAKNLAARAAEGGYIDVHNWVFTPHQLRLMLQDLHELGYVDVVECYFHETVGHEFFLNLRRGGPSTGLTREELLVLADAELTSRELATFV